MSKENEARLGKKIEWEDFYEDMEVQDDYLSIMESNEDDIDFGALKEIVKVKDQESRGQILEEGITIESLRLKHALNMWDIKQSASLLKLGEIEKDTVVSSENAKKIIAECHRLNREKANACNPNFAQAITEQPLFEKVRMSDLMMKYNVGIGTIKDIARRHNMSEIWNDYSFTTPQNLKIMIEEIKIGKEKTITLANNADNHFADLLENDFKIFIDTSSWMQDNILDLIEMSVIPILEKYNDVVYLVDSVLNEIDKKMKYPENEIVAEKAKKAQEALRRLGMKDLYQIHESGSCIKTFADAELISVFTDLRFKYNLCLITNDYSKEKQGGLAGSIVRLKEDPNIHNIRQIRVFSVSHEEQSKLVEFFLDRDTHFQLHINPPHRVKL